MRYELSVVLPCYSIFFKRIFEKVNPFHQYIFNIFTDVSLFYESPLIYSFHTHINHSTKTISRLSKGVPFSFTEADARRFCSSFAYVHSWLSLDVVDLSHLHPLQSTSFDYGSLYVPLCQAIVINYFDHVSLFIAGLTWNTSV